MLVDESHRSQYGTANALMQNVFPKACYIGFTGKPLLKKDKKTADKFGGFIHKYTMKRAVEDGAVVPLKYEGRDSALRGAQEQLDKWFDRVTRALTPLQKSDLKRKFRSAETVLEANARLQEIAFDIGMHFKSFTASEERTGLKGQFAVSSKLDAIRYRKIFNKQGDIEDVRDALEDVGIEIGLLSVRHTHVWDVFKGVQNQQDSGARQEWLYPQDRRDAFYDARSSFVKTLKLALSNPKFLDETPEDVRKRYLNDLKYFLGLRKAVMFR